ncbi:MAG: AAA family ATPase [Clostridiales bacterium]|jgi:predicted AAA+ superfamily ATPase|nr:AAA family ATPase [Clostridiales bacterium]
MTSSIFLTGDDLLKLTETLTAKKGTKFKRRDFVEPLIEFCANNEFDAKLGVIFGLRSTGKTVGMLQAAEFLLQQGKKVAYACFNYQEQRLDIVNSEILALAKSGYTHFFIDEAPYLRGFLNHSVEWADLSDPIHRLKIIITGTDSFLLWFAMEEGLKYRYVCFLSNSSTFPEYKRLLGKGYDEYKVHGGVFLPEYAAVSALSPGNKNVRIENFIEGAVVYNMMHSLEIYKEDYTSDRYFLNWLSFIDKPVIFKGIIHLLEQIAGAMIKNSLIHHSIEPISTNSVKAIEHWSALEKIEIKAKFAENFLEIDYPDFTLDVMLLFLINIGLLIKSGSSFSDLTKMQETLYFAHPAVMSYVLDQAKRSLWSISGFDTGNLSSSLPDASERALNANIVYCHFLRFSEDSDKIFLYHDQNDREIDVVSVNRRLNWLRLVEVESKSEFDDSMVFDNEAKDLYDKEILKNIGVDEKFSIIRIIAYNGENKCIANIKGDLILLNIEDLLCRIKDLDAFIGEISAT